ncbi:MAG: hypothetical protein RI900_303 [Actinomycetota bacterium]
MHTPVSHQPPRTMRREGCTSENWTQPPWNRWGFSHVRELARTARIQRGDGPVWEFARRSVPLEEMVIPHQTGPFTLVDALRATYTDAFVVLHKGELVWEWYEEHIRPDRPHLIMSVSKSLTSTLIGALVGEGLLSVDGRVEQYVPALRGTAWEGATLQHLLDMSAGVRFDEDDYDNPESDGILIEQVSGYRTRMRDDLPTDTASWIVTLQPQGTHGDRFQYRSIITDVLGWVVEAVTGQRFADAFSQRIWSRIGAEHDGDLIVDAKGFPTVEGGICVTARDLARVGQLHLQRGLVRGEQVVPAEWTDHVLQGDDTLRTHMAAAGSEQGHEYYHDCWWVFDSARGLYAGHGINGQHVFVDRSTQTVIAQQSTTPFPLDTHLMLFGTDVVMRVLDRFA